MATATYTHYVVRSVSAFGGVLNQGFGSTPEKAWADACGPDWADYRKSGSGLRVVPCMWLCMCDKEFCDSHGMAGEVGPACDDPTE